MNNLLNIMVVISQMNKQGYNVKECLNATAFQLVTGLDTAEFEAYESDNKYNSANYFDLLSSHLTRVSDCGMPILAVDSAISDILYSKYNRSVYCLSIDAMQTVYLKYLTDSEKLDLLDINLSMSLLRQCFIFFVKKMTISQLNQFFKDYQTYIDCAKAKDWLITDTKGNIYFDYDCNGTYKAVSISDILSIVSDFTYWLEFEDFELIFDFILKDWLKSFDSFNLEIL